MRVLYVVSAPASQSRASDNESVWQRKSRSAPRAARAGHLKCIPEVIPIIVVFALAVLCLSVRGQSSVTLAWNASTSSDVTGYNLYYGGASQTYTNMKPVGNMTNTTISSLLRGGTYYFSVTAIDAVGLESPNSNEITYTVPNTNSVPATNTPPLISSIPNQVLTVGSSTPALPFTVQDAQTPASSLVVTPTSSNPTLVPNTGMVLGGSGTNRTITITPAAGQTGNSTIALTVCDTGLCATTTFVLTVNPLPLPLPSVVLTSPTNGAIFAAPASITLTANVTANGHTITGVQFYNGSTLLGQATTTPYSFTWNNVGAGTYSLTARAIYDAGSSVASGAQTITVQPASTLPLPWQTADIGSPGISGSASVSSGIYTVTGAGNLSGSADNFRFVYQALSGDGEIACQVNSMQKTGGGSCAGVMIRENLTSGARNAFMGIASPGGFRAQRRTSSGGSTSATKAGQASPPNAWVRLVRAGDTLSSYKSADGKSWTLVNSAPVTMATNIYVGVAVASGTSTVANTSVFSNVTVVP